VKGPLPVSFPIKPDVLTADMNVVKLPAAIAVPTMSLEGAV